MVAAVYGLKPFASAGKQNAQTSALGVVVLAVHETRCRRGSVTGFLASFEVPGECLNQIFRFEVFADGRINRFGV